MNRMSGSMQQKMASYRCFAKKRAGTIAFCGILCALVGPNCVFVGRALSAGRATPQRSIGVAMYERAPHGVGDNIVLLRSDNSWNRAVVTDVKKDGTTYLKVDGSPSANSPGSPSANSPGSPSVKSPGSSSVKSTSESRSNFGSRRKSGAPVDPFKSAIVDAIRVDLQHQFTDGFVATPFSPNVRSANPFIETKGRLTSEVLKAVSPLQFLNLYMAGDSATFKIKSIQQADPDIDPFYGLPSPPRGRVQEHWADATWAVHAEWEIQGKGRFQFAPLIEQKPFYLSGHDVFRVDANGKVITHERGYDQDLRSVLAYFDPYAHIPGLDKLRPVTVPKKPEQRSD